MLKKMPLYLSFILLCLPTVGNAFIEKDDYRNMNELIKELDSFCKDMDWNGLKSSNFERADLTGDGVKEYIFSESEFICKNGFQVGGFGQAAGVYVYKETATGGLHRLLDADAIEGRYKIIKRKGETRLYTLVRGEACGDYDYSRSTAEMEYCYRPYNWSEKKQKFDFAPLKDILKDIEE